MSVFIHNTIFVIQNGVKRNEESVENQCGSSFVGMTKLLYFQTYDKLRTFNKKFIETDYPQGLGYGESLDLNG
tara:strand:- start:128 stop:346 length:219 start_codon:yes stop_codon:yes gene_type:complete